MANPYPAVVAGKLAYAEALLRLEGVQANSNPIIRAALIHGALMHLQSAWRAYLREVGANYQLRHMDAVVSAETLSEALRGEGKVPSEASELRDLEADTASWAGQLRALWHREGGSSTMSASGEGPSASRTAEGVIAVTGGPSQMVLDAATVSQLMTAFVELIDRQRNTMIEC